MLLKIENLTKKFQNHLVFEHLSLNLDKGSIVGILGSNGTGKTTLFKMIAGLQRRYDGEILLEGQKPGCTTAAWVSYLPDHDFFESQRSVADYVNLFPSLFNNFNKNKALQMLQRFGLNLQTKIMHLSKGDREKLALALTMARNAKIYLLDEPLSAVDAVAREYILQLILEYYDSDSLILISTHLIQDLEQILDYAVFLGNGGIILEGETETLREKYQKGIVSIFREVYGQTEVYGQ